jgi:parallel beta-helix repeat protein
MAQGDDGSLVPVPERSLVVDSLLTRVLADLSRGQIGPNPWDGSTIWVGKERWCQYDDPAEAAVDAPAGARLVILPGSYVFDGDQIRLVTSIEIVGYGKEAEETILATGKGALEAPFAGDLILRNLNIVSEVVDGAAIEAFLSAGMLLIDQCLITAPGGTAVKSTMVSNITELVDTKVVGADIGLSTDGGTLLMRRCQISVCQRTAAEIKGSNAQIEGCLFDTVGQSAVRLSAEENTSISCRGNVIRSCQSGIVVGGYGPTIIEENDIDHCHSGVGGYRSNMVIRNNRLSNCDQGIALVNCDSVLEGNLFLDCEDDVTEVHGF